METMTSVYVRAQSGLHDLRARSNERGAAMAEYGLLLALVALAAIGILAAFGGELVEVFSDAEEAIDNRDTIAPED